LPFDAVCTEGRFAPFDVFTLVRPPFSFLLLAEWTVFALFSDAPVPFGRLSLLSFEGIFPFILVPPFFQKIIL
jgi:hypothetical protein